MKVTNPISDEKDSYRVKRGGGWDYDARYARASFRYDADRSDRGNDALGFRLVRNK